MPSLVEIDRTLPNGFHDSEVRAYKLDFVKRTAMFEIDVWVGDLDAATPDGRELYRAGLLVVSGLAFCKVDAPYDRAGGVREHLARLGEGLVGTEQHGLLRVVATGDDLEEQIETVDEGREAAWAGEIRTRLDAWQRGEVAAVSADDFLARLGEVVSGDDTP